VRVDADAVLVGNAVPGDVLELNMQGKRRGVLRADVIAIIEASDQRVPPPCPVADQCGGCALQYIAPSEQASLKSNWVTDAFRACIAVDTEVIAAGGNTSHLRRRVRWFSGQDEDGSFLGFYAPASHRPVRHSDCMVLTAELNAVRYFIEHEIALQGIDSVQAIQLDDGVHVVLETAIQPEKIEQKSIAGLPLQWWWRDGNHITRPLHKPVQYFHDVLPAGGADVRLIVGPDDFVQGQAQGNAALITQIQIWTGSVKRIADLFCGIGNLSLPLAAATEAEVFGAELNPASVRAASNNAKALGIKAQFSVANLFEDFDHEPYIGADVLLLDPPRRGAKRVCGQIGQLLPKKIIMLSCDVAAGARDGVLLRKQGYRLQALRALDLFPYAGHVEAMSLWVLE
ncbi:MAG: class I SAM-dependent RNA methyltransferase, partial [Mariprofundus sp.]|nr:class I SAM-dependent RNA methyltransferase [Mariprofundus sp.]